MSREYRKGDYRVIYQIANMLPRGWRSLHMHDQIEHVILALARLSYCKLRREEEG